MQNNMLQKMFLEDKHIPCICEKIVKYKTVPNFFTKEFNTTGQQAGIILAYNYDDTIFIGHSACCPKDIFSKERAYEIATSRAEKYFYKTQYNVNRDNADQFEKFLYRVAKYFKYSEGLYKFPAWYKLWKEEYAVE